MPRISENQQLELLKYETALSLNIVYYTVDIFLIASPQQPMLTNL